MIQLNRFYVEKAKNEIPFQAKKKQQIAISDEMTHMMAPFAQYINYMSMRSSAPPHLVLIKRVQTKASQSHMMENGMLKNNSRD